MKKQEKEHDKHSVLPWVLFLSVIIFWIGLPFIFSTIRPDLSQRGQLGDSFGGITALFSGLALAGIIWAIVLQKEEIKIQQEELKNAQREMREQKRAIQIEGFERSFFQFLATLEVKFLSVEYIREVEFSKGSEDADQRYKTLKQRGIDIISPIPTKEEGDSIYFRMRSVGKEAFEQATWQEITEDMFRIKACFNPYYSLMYKILLFIDKANFIEDKNFYTGILRDQAKDDEMLMLYRLIQLPDWWIGLGHGNIDGATFKKFMHKYSLFLNVRLFDDKDKKSIPYFSKKTFGYRRDINKVFDKNPKRPLPFEDAAKEMGG